MWTSRFNQMTLKHHIWLESSTHVNVLPAQAAYLLCLQAVAQEVEDVTHQSEGWWPCLLPPAPAKPKLLSSAFIGV